MPVPLDVADYPELPVASGGSGGVIAGQGGGPSVYRLPARRRMVRVDDETIRVARATITLPGLPFGQTAEVDTASPYVAECLALGYLVLEPTVELLADAGGS